MGKLEDYAGEFRPNLRLHEFSVDALVNLWYTAAKLYVGIDGLWLSLLRERLGDETAWELAHELWRRNTPLEVRRTMETMNIQGDDVATYFKVWQVDPGMAGIAEMEFDLKNNSHGVLTVKRCLPLEYFERHGDSALQRHGCGVDEEEFPITARMFNPRMKCTCLKLPPRRSREETACQWEFEIR